MSYNKLRDAEHRNLLLGRARVQYTKRAVACSSIRSALAGGAKATHLPLKTHYVNYTSKNMVVIDPSGARIHVVSQVAPRTSPYDGEFLIIDDYNERVPFYVADLATLENIGKDAVSSLQPLREVMEANDVRNDRNRQYVVTSIAGKDLIASNDGIAVYDKALTVCVNSSDYDIRNKALDILPSNSESAARAAGLRLVFYATGTHYSNVFAVMGDKVFTVHPSNNDTFSGIVELYKTDEMGVERLVKSLPIAEVLEKGIDGIHIYTTLVDAEEYARTLPKALESKSALMQEIDKLTLENAKKAEVISKYSEKLSELEKDLKHSKRNLEIVKLTAKEEKAKQDAERSTSFWAKVIGFGTGAIGLIGTIIKLYLSLKKSVVI